MRFINEDLPMNNETNKDQIPFIHQFKRETRTPESWKDKFRVCWFFNPNTLDYIYEHKDEKFRTNGFVLSKGFVEQLPDELRKKFFEANERGLIFSVFGSMMLEYILTDSVSDIEFVSIFGLSKSRYFNQEAFDEFEAVIDLI